MRWLLPSIALLLAALCTAWLLDLGGTAPLLPPGSTVGGDAAGDRDRPDPATGRTVEAAGAANGVAEPASVDREEVAGETVSATVADAVPPRPSEIA